MISEETIQDFFEKTRAMYREGRAKFNIDDVCRWSFFFVDRSREQLLKAVPTLEACGYEIAGLLEASHAVDPQGVTFLRVDRVEHHTVESLLARNDELYKLAKRLDLSDYDGMDVGPVDGP